MDSQYYVINDINNFTDSTRKIVFGLFGQDIDQSYTQYNPEFIDTVINFSQEEETELNAVLSLPESLNIVKGLLKKQKNKITKKYRYIIDDEILAEIVEALNARLVSNLLAGLVNKGLVESTYDTEINDFVFWIKDSENN
jgi:hypothetical protein